MDVGRQKHSKTEVKLRFWGITGNPYPGNGGSTSKTEVKLLGPSQPFRTKWTLDVKNWGKIAILRCHGQPPLHAKWRFDVKNWSKIAILLGPSQPFRTKWTLNVKNWSKIAISRVRSLCVNVFVCKMVCVWKCLCVKASVCKRVCV